nr:MAG TPA: hypothetical protein [Caudoviricetes sp.]
MKKALALILILLIVAVPVLAEGLDFSSMTIDELISLRSAITQEIESRIEDADFAHAANGIYKIGEDIDAGVYTFSRSTDDKYCDIKMCATLDDYDNYRSEWSYTISTTDSIRAELIDEYYLIVEGYGGIDIRKADKIIVP